MIEFKNIILALICTIILAIIIIYIIAWNVLDVLEYYEFKRNSKEVEAQVIERVDDAVLKIRYYVTGETHEKRFRVGKIRQVNIRIKKIFQLGFQLKIKIN